MHNNTDQITVMHMHDVNNHCICITCSSKVWDLHSGLELCALGGNEAGRLCRLPDWLILDKLPPFDVSRSAMSDILRISVSWFCNTPSFVGLFSALKWIYKCQAKKMNIVRIGYELNNLQQFTTLVYHLKSCVQSDYITAHYKQHWKCC